MNNVSSSYEYKDYKIKKRKAAKIEELDPPIQQTAPAKEDHRIGPPGLEPFTYENYEWKQVKNKTIKPRSCIYCGKPASSI